MTDSVHTTFRGLLLVVAVALAAPSAALEPCGEFQVNDYTSGLQIAPTVAVDPTGAFVVVWVSNGSTGTDDDDHSIQARRYDANGSPLGAQFQVNTYTTGRQSSPAVAVGPAGLTLVAWESAGSPATDTDGASVQARALGATGAPVGEQFQVNAYTPGHQRDPRLVADDAGGFVVVWESDGSAGTDGDSFSIQGRRVAATGPTAAEFQVNSYTTSFQLDPDVARDGAGGFVVVWVGYGSFDTDVDSTSIQARRLDGGASPIGTDFQVNTHTSSYQDYPRVDDTGAGFVVVWRSDGGPGDDTHYGSTQARRYDAAGAPLAAQFQVNTLTTDEQRTVAVAGDGSGGFLVTWESARSLGADQDGWSIQGRRYEGTAVSPQFEVNQHTAGSQHFPHMEGDDAGGFVVAWYAELGAGGDPADAIEARRLEDACMPPTSTPSNTSSTSSTSSSSTTSTSSTTSSTSTSTSSIPISPEPTTSTSTSSIPSSTSTSTTSSSVTTSSTILTTSTIAEQSTTTSVSTTITTTSLSSTSSTGPAPSSTTSSSTSTSSTTSVSSTVVPSTATTTSSSTSSTIPASLLSGQALTIVEGRPGRRRPRIGRLALLSADPGIDVGRGSGGVDDPTLAGGSLRIVSLVDAFDVWESLPAGDWKASRRGYRYRGPTGTRVRLTPAKRLQVRLKGPDFPLGEGAPLPIVIVLRLGEHRLCLEFSEGDLDTRRGKLTARAAPPPLDCHEPTDA